MKRLSIVMLVIAVALAMAVGTTQAKTIYEADNFKLNLGGDWEIQLKQDAGTDEDLDVEYDDLEIQTGVEYTINDTLTAFGEADFGMKKAADDSDRDTPHIEDAYVGLRFQNVELVVGKTSSASDEFGVSGDFEAPVPAHAADEWGATSGDDLIKVSVNIADMVTLVASHEFSADSEDSNADGEFTDFFASVEFSGMTLGVQYEIFEPAPEEEGMDTDDMTFYGIMGTYDAKIFNVGLSYSVADETEDAIANIFVGIPLDAVELGVGYTATLLDEGDDVNGWYVNAAYTLTEGVTLKAEIGGNDEDDSDVGYFVGLKLKF